jgi:hypothetical protein
MRPHLGLVKPQHDIFLGHPGFLQVKSDPMLRAVTLDPDLAGDDVEV